MQENYREVIIYSSKLWYCVIWGVGQVDIRNYILCLLNNYYLH